MSVTVLVMAGGKGTRMKRPEEKPLLKVGGKPMIEHILNALTSASKVDEIVVAVSKHTPKTARIVKKFSAKVLETPGEDFISDTKYAVKKLKLSTVVTVSADLPLLSGEMVDKIIESYDRCGKPALAVMVPAETRERLCLNVDYVVEMEGRCLVPAGINVLDARKINETELDEEKLVLDMKAIAVNVNTPEDLKIAERLFRLKV